MSLSLDVTVNNPMCFKPETCPICLEDMWSSCQLPCGHRFHEKCIHTWLVRQLNCPYCRGSFFPVVESSVMESSVFFVTVQDDDSSDSSMTSGHVSPVEQPMRDNALCAKVFRFCFGSGRQ